MPSGGDGFVLRHHQRRSASTTDSPYRDEMGETCTFGSTIMDRSIQNLFWTNQSANARLVPMARPKEFDQDLALMHAIGVFASYGYEGTSTEALIEAMGISRQSLYD